MSKPNKAETINTRALRHQHSCSKGSSCSATWLFNPLEICLWGISPTDLRVQDKCEHLGAFHTPASKEVKKVECEMSASILCEHSSRSWGKKHAHTMLTLPELIVQRGRQTSVKELHHVKMKGNNSMKQSPRVL